MAMNKREKAHLEEVERACAEKVEALEARLALRFTGPVEEDVLPPDDMSLNVGFTFNLYRREVAASCSSCISHSTHSSTETTTQRSISMFSTELLALKALRHAVELDCAKTLRQIDLKIEATK